MFDGVPDQFHQFITPPRTTSLPLHLPFPLHASPSAPPTNNTTFPSFDPYNPSPPPPPPPHHHHHHQLPLQLQPNLLHHLHHQPPSTHQHHKVEHDEAEKEENSSVPMNFEIDQRDQNIDPWTNDEVLSLLRIRSSMENWFPELTWEHVSRKLAELGYKRSAEKCKEKFEEESRYFSNNINFTKNNNNYRFLNELEELYNQGENQQVGETTHQKQITSIEEEGQDKIMDLALEVEGCSTKQKEQGGDDDIEEVEEEEEVVVEKTNKEERPKRKRPDRFELFKGFCESIVHKMIEQQEEMHKKLIEDMLKRDEEKFAREEAWKKQEMDRVNQELEIMAQEQAIAGDRQANIIEFLNKFSSTTTTTTTTTSTSSQIIKVITNVSNQNTCTTTTAAAPSSPPPSQNPNPSNMVLHHQNNNVASETENPSSVPSQETLLQKSSSTTTTTTPSIIKNPSSSSSLNRQNNNTCSVSNNNNKVSSASNVIISSSEKDGVGRRWPKDEVLALINLRCNSVNNSNSSNEENNNNNKEGNKAPLWERISQGMLELGYERSAKRCKEKWENINKYFRKTKDVNKKRSLDSRTCPYFHQLSNLYNQGKLVLQSDQRQENQLLSSPLVNNNPVQVNTPEHHQINHQSQLAEPSSTHQVVGSGGFSMQQQQVDHHGGEKTLMRVPSSLDFDQF